MTTCCSALGLKRRTGSSPGPASIHWSEQVGFQDDIFCFLCNNPLGIGLHCPGRASGWLSPLLFLGALDPFLLPSTRLRTAACKPLRLPARTHLWSFSLGAEHAIACAHCYAEQSWQTKALFIHPCNVQRKQRDPTRVFPQPSLTPPSWAQKGPACSTSLSHEEQLVLHATLAFSPLNNVFLFCQISL